MTVIHLVPVAQYVRMSDEAQQYSVDNQKLAIQEYASRHGFTIVKTYADLGKSGVVAKHRTALQELLRDVVSGEAGYKAVLVYDVSRWGRFPNNDEAAHYEFICSSTGIPLHYCAEQFANDGTASSALLKALKRSMAAEFSRELGDKVFRGKTRIVQLGFLGRGTSGYGYRRLMVSAEGRPKQVMKPGEQKSLTTDRVILIPGPRKELKAIRAIFSLAADGNGPTAIARKLESSYGITHDGKPWNHEGIYKIVRNPKYMGCNTWNRLSQRLHAEPRRASILCSQVRCSHGRSLPIVDEETFERAQAGLPADAGMAGLDESGATPDACSRPKVGSVSGSSLRGREECHQRTLFTNHFGTYRQLHEKVGYPPGRPVRFHKRTGKSVPRASGESL